MKHFASSTWSSRTGIDHPPGTVLAGATIIRKAANGGNETRFLVLAARGHEHIFNGSTLRSKNRDGETALCPPCSLANRKPRKAVAK